MNGRRFPIIVAFLVGIFVGIGLTLAWQGNVTVTVPVPTNPIQLETL